MDTKSVLIENIKEFIRNAKKSKEEKSYNSSVTLYFKAISVITDLFIYLKEGFIPSNHSNRFRILETKYPELYNILDKSFPVYQQSYSLKMGIEQVEELENDTKRILEITKIDI